MLFSRRFQNYRQTGRRVGPITGLCRLRLLARLRRGSVGGPPRQSRPGLAIVAVALSVAAAAIPVPVAAQNLLSSEPMGLRYPPDEYYLGLQAYRAGDLDAAVNLFDRAVGRGRIDGDGRWIDSIPALTLLAECHWQLGSLVMAKQQLDLVFQIAVRRRGWLGRVDWQSMLVSGGQRSPPPNLWREAAAVRLVPVSDRATFHAGSPLTEQRLALGGVIEEPNIRSFDAGEVLRCLALAAHRRRIILGPLSDHDELATALLEATKYPAELQIPTARALIGSLRASGYFSAGDAKRAIENANRFAMADGAAHPLSAMAMLTLGETAVSSEQASAAVPSLLRAVHVAAALEQFELIGPTLQLAVGSAEPQQLPVVLATINAIAPLLSRQSRLAALHVWIAGADAAVTAGDPTAATQLLNQAAALSSRRDVALPRLNAYAAFVAARLAALQGSAFGVNSATEVDQAWMQLRRFMLEHRFRNSRLVSMPSVYQLGLLQAALGKSLGDKSGQELLSHYLSGPSLAQWRRDPVDALAAQVMDRSNLHAARVEQAAENGDREEFLLRADTLKADQFSQHLPLRGRVLQVRGLARLDESALDAGAIDWLAQAPPVMQQLRARVVANRAVSNDILNELESLATSIALSRLQIPQVNLPQLDSKFPLAELPSRAALLVFVQTGNQKLYAALATANEIRLWSVAAGPRLPAEIGRLLREIGVGRPRGKRLPSDESWRASGAKLFQELIPQELAADLESFDRLIIVPDGPLWYLPFELLPMGDPAAHLWGDRVRISYAPTPAAALRSTADAAGSPRVGLVAGPLFAPQDPERNGQQVDSILAAIQQPIRIPEQLEQPSGWLGPSLGHLVVAAPRTAQPKHPLTMVVSPHDGEHPAGTLAGWLRFPAAVPQSAVLIALRTPVDAGQMGDGSELFLTLAALQAAGVRNVLLSRWAVGGESTSLLLRELLQELPYSGIQDAWERAKLVLRRSELDPAAEPLMTKAEHSREDVTGGQPLFWAGYLVSGPLSTTDAPALAPVD